MNCTHCGSGRSCRFGRSARGGHRYRCHACGRIFRERRRTIGNRHLPFDRACETARLIANSTYRENSKNPARAGTRCGVHAARPSITRPRPTDRSALATRPTWER